MQSLAYNIARIGKYGAVAFGGFLAGHVAGSTYPWAVWMPYAMMGIGIAASLMFMMAEDILAPFPWED